MNPVFEPKIEQQIEKADALLAKVKSQLADYEKLFEEIDRFSIEKFVDSYPGMKEDVREESIKYWEAQGLVTQTPEKIKIKKSHKIRQLV